MSNRHLLSLATIVLLLATCQRAPAAAQELPEYGFVVAADSRDPCTGGMVNATALGAVFAAIGGLAPAPRFAFFGGDLTCGYTDVAGLDAEWALWESIVDAAMAPEPAFSEKVYEIFGGHERTVETNRSPWSGFREYFQPVDQTAVAGMTCHYYDGNDGPVGSDSPYSFTRTVYYCDYGPDRFFVVNNDCVAATETVTGSSPDAMGCVTHEVGCAQFNWIKRHLVGNGKRHNFFFQHEPAYGVGSHDAYTGSCGARAYTMDNKQAARNDWIRLLGHNNTRVIFSGHEHHYTRRRIDDAFVQLPINSPGGVPTTRSLAIAIESDPPGQIVATANAHSWEAGAHDLGPELRLWWDASGTASWTGRGRASSDDAEEFFDGTSYIDSSDLELMRDSHLGEQRRVMMRWTNVPISEGANIYGAEIRFTAKASSGPGPLVRIRGEATAFAHPFSRCRNDLGARATTVASVPWQIPAWSQGSTYATPDLSAIIQELIDTHGHGQPIPGEILEVKTGNAGAPWADRFCPDYMANIESEMIDYESDYGATPPYHFALVEVFPDEVEVTVFAADAARTLLSPRLRVSKTGLGYGTVTSQPAGIDCGTDCDHVYGHADVVQLSATPDLDSSFSGWSGDCEHVGEVTMLGDQECAAIFGPCGAQHAVLEHVTITDHQRHNACEVLTVGSSVLIADGGVCDLRASDTVVFTGPFEVRQGGSLTVANVAVGCC